MTNRARRTEELMAQFDIIDRPTLERIKYDMGYIRADYVDVMMDGVEALDVSGNPSLPKRKHCSPAGI